MASRIGISAQQSMAIVGGTAVWSDRMAPANLLISEGVIREVADPDTSLEADTVVDATGLLVLPGLIDNHTHLNMPFGGTVTADDFETGTAAAAAGGTTTIIDFALQTHGSLRAGVDTWMEKAEGRAHIDYGFHIAISDASAEALGEMEEVASEGVTSFKVFMAYKGALMVNDEQMLAVLERSGEVGGLVLVHAENGDAVDLLVRRALSSGHTDPVHHALTRPPMVEAEATARAGCLAAALDQPLFVVHVTCREALEELERVRAEGGAIAGETCIQYLTLTEDDLARPDFDGAKYVCSPPLRPQHHQTYLWKALRTGSLSACSTDHAPFNFREQKELGRGDFSKIPNGLPTIEHRLSLLYEHGVRRGRLSLPDVVRVTATEPARYFGLDNRKGAILPGLDADLVLYNPAKGRELSVDAQTMNVDYCVHQGWRVTGTVEKVFSRGELIVDDGQVISDPGRGEFLARASGSAYQRRLLADPSATSQVAA